MKTETGVVERLKGYNDFTSPDVEVGLPIDVRIEGDKGLSEFQIPKHFVGWRGADEDFAHKGAVATALETVMAFSGIKMLKKATNAKTVTIEYFAQIPLEERIRAEARVVSQRGGVEAVIEAELHDGKGNVLARSTGTYALYSAEQLSDMSSVPFSELAFRPGVGGLAACRPEDLANFINTI